MNADQLREVRERHDATERNLAMYGPHAAIRGPHSDRALLLAEVDRLKGLCGRAYRELANCEPCSIGPDSKRIKAELREASK